MTLENTSVTSQNKEDVLSAQPYLTEYILSDVVINCPKFPSASVERVIKRQEWSTEKVLSFALKNDKIMNDHLQGIFMHQPYALSQEMLVKYVERQPNLTEKHIKEFLLRQPVIGDNVVKAMLKKVPKLNSITLHDLILYSEEFPSDEVFNELIISEILTPQDMESLIEIKPSTLTHIQIDLLESIEKYSNINALTPEQGYYSACAQSSVKQSYSYIENITDYEYFEADYLGRPSSNAFGQFNVNTVSFEPSWQIYRTK
jgi:hypothetical protein